MNTTKSLIKKIGWKKKSINHKKEKEEVRVFYRGKTLINSNCFVAFHLGQNGTIKGIFIRNDVEISFEELQGIYEIAQQIKEENNGKEI